MHHATWFRGALATLTSYGCNASSAGFKEFPSPMRAGRETELQNPTPTALLTAPTHLVIGLGAEQGLYYQLRHVLPADGPAHSGVLRQDTGAGSSLTLQAPRPDDDIRHLPLEALWCGSRHGKTAGVRAGQGRVECGHLHPSTPKPYRHAAAAAVKWKHVSRVQKLNWSAISLLA